MIRRLLTDYNTFCLFEFTVNTWLGDPIRALQAKVIIDSVYKYDLLTLVNETGNYLTKQLGALSVKYPKFISSVRGRGTYMAFDCVDSATRDKLVYELRQVGLNMGGSGDVSVRLRPMLVLEKKHCDIFLDRLEKVIKKMN